LLGGGVGGGWVGRIFCEKLAHGFR